MLRQGCGPHFRGVYHSKHKRTKSKLPEEIAKEKIHTIVSHSNTAPTPSLKTADNKRKLLASFAKHFDEDQ